MKKLYLRQGAMMMGFSTRRVLKGMRVYNRCSMLNMHMGKKRYATIVRDEKYW